MKKHCRMLGLLGICVLLACAGCGTTEQEEVPTEPIVFSYDPDASEAGTQTSPIEQYGLDILPVVCVEAGTEALTDELFFETYSGQTLAIGQELTAEELSVYGASYQIPVTYSGYDLTIEVDVVDTTLPQIEKTDDIIVKVGQSIAYKKAISYTDNSSNDLTLDIDHSAVDASTPGEYTVVYTVTDAAGNSASLELTLAVVEAASHTEEDVKDLALAVLDEVYDPEASEYDNALALFKWVHSSIVYTHSSGDRSSVWAGAYEGLCLGRGDCYAFYATYAVLLTYAGIENECVARVSDSSNHWWNLVNTGDGWYHCDTSPRRDGDGYFCFMQTDAQVDAYTRAYPEKPDYYTFDGSLLPDRATNIIYGYDPDTIYEKYNTEAVEAHLAEIAAKKAEAEAAEEDEAGLTEETDVDEAEQFINEEEEAGEQEEEAASETDKSKKKEKKKKKEKEKEKEEAADTEEAETSEPAEEETAADTEEAEAAVDTEEEAAAEETTE